MKKFKQISIPIEIYKHGLHILIGDDIDKVRKFTLDRGYDFSDEYFYNYDGNHIKREGHWGIIQIRKYKDEHLVHELSHAVFHILNDVGIELYIYNNEAFAYLFDYLFTEIKKKLKTPSKKKHS